MVRSVLTVLILCTVLVGSLGSAARACEGKLTPVTRYEDVFSQYQKPHSFLRLEAGETLRQPTRLSMVHLVVEQGDDVGAIAEALAVRQDATRIENNLREYLQHSKSIRIPLTEILMIPALEWTGQRSPTRGANCFNAVECWNMGLKLQRYLDPYVFIEFLNEHARVLLPGEELRFGDTLVVLEKIYPNLPVHAAIYLNDQFVWEKAGSSENLPWTFAEMKTALQDYGLSATRAARSDTRLVVFRIKANDRTEVETLK